jgi:HEPN domain-containing protein
MNEHEQWVRQWLNKATTDFETALVLMESGRPLFWPMCYHCQQAVEKSLKAFLIWSGRPVAKTHDLEKLLQECTTLDTDFSFWERHCFILNDYAVIARYPDDRVELGPDEAHQDCPRPRTSWIS